LGVAISVGEGWMLMGREKTGKKVKSSASNWDSADKI